VLRCRHGRGHPRDPSSEDDDLGHTSGEEVSCEKGSSQDCFLRGRKKDRGNLVPTPLAYVFWHWPRAGKTQGSYERRLLAFQESLRSNPPGGMIDALSFRERRPPWSQARKTTYEDWYLVEDYASLGSLNEGAVSRANRDSHDQVAREASAGAGGLYRLRSGRPRLREAGFATWFEKPARTAYQAFLGGV
jgi:hypothetical protein